MSPTYYEDDNSELLLNTEPSDLIDTEILASTDSAPASLNQQHPPPDRFNLVAITFFTIGLSQLLPWNFLVTATNYWMFKFRDLNNSTVLDFDKASYDEKKSELQKYFDSYLAIASNLPFLLVFAISLIQGLKKVSDLVKNVVTFVSILLVFSIINAFVLVDTDKFQATFLKITLILVFFLNSFAGYLQANFAGIISLFPSHYMHYMVTGQAMSGLFSALANILSIAGSWSIVESTFAYFLCANLALLITFGLYMFVSRTMFYQYYHMPSRYVNQAGTADDSVLTWPLFKMVFGMMWPYLLTLTCVFWATFAVFPGIVVLITPQNEQEDSFWTSKYFLPVCCFLSFNLFDFLGRYLGRFILFPKEKGLTVLALSLCRTVFIPLFMFTNVLPRHLPVLFHSEYYYVFFGFAYAFTNGYLVLNVFVNGPLMVPPESRKISGFFLVVFLGLGLTLGSLSSNLLLRIL